MRNKATVITAVIAVIVVIAAAGVGLRMRRSGLTPDLDKGEVKEITYEQPVVVGTTVSETVYRIPTTVATTAPETTTVLTPEEAYVQRFLEEAQSYTLAAEPNSASDSPLRDGFFNVVTSGGTVSDDSSLDGLEGTERKIGDIILAAGFRYDKNQNIFYSDKYSWQRYFGFTPIYDAGAALTGMYYDTMRILFNYGDRDWMFQLWKGRYGITTGGEMGIYNKPQGNTNELNLYSTATDADMITMSFALYRGEDLYMVRGPEQNWWLTGFRIFDMVDPNELTMHATFFLDDSGMADAMEQSIQELGFIKNVNYQRLGLTMTIVWR